MNNLNNKKLVLIIFSFLVIELGMSSSGYTLVINRGCSVGNEMDGVSNKSKKIYRSYPRKLKMEEIINYWKLVASNTTDSPNPFSLTKTRSNLGIGPSRSTSSNSSASGSDSVSSGGGLATSTVSASSLSTSNISTGRTIVVIPDTHGDLNAFISPLLVNGLATIGNPSTILVEISSGRVLIKESEIYSCLHTTEINCIRIPNIKLNMQMATNFGVVYLGDIIDRGDYSDECLYLMNYMLDQESENFKKNTQLKQDVTAPQLPVNNENRDRESASSSTANMVSSTGSTANTSNISNPSNSSSTANMFNINKETTSKRKLINYIFGNHETSLLQRYKKTNYTGLYQYHQNSNLREYEMLGILRKIIFSGHQVAGLLENGIWFNHSPITDKFFLKFNKLLPYLSTLTNARNRPYWKKECNSSNLYDPQILKSNPLLKEVLVGCLNELFKNVTYDLLMKVDQFLLTSCIIGEEEPVDPQKFFINYNLDSACYIYNYIFNYYEASLFWNIVEEGTDSFTELSVAYGHTHNRDYNLDHKGQMCFDYDSSSFFGLYKGQWKRFAHKSAPHYALIDGKTGEVRDFTISEEKILSITELDMSIVNSSDIFKNDDL